MIVSHKTNISNVLNKMIVNESFSLIGRHQKELSGNGWLEIDVTELLTENGKEEINFEIDFKIECFTLDWAKTLSFEQVGIVTSDPYRPFLVSKRRKRRTKRQDDRQVPEATEDEEDLGASPTELDDQSRACEAVPIYYKFDDYGWDVRIFVLFFSVYVRLIQILIASTSFPRTGSFHRKASHPPFVKESALSR